MLFLFGVGGTAQVGLSLGGMSMFTESRNYTGEP